MYNTYMTSVMQKKDTLPPELRAIIEGDEIISIINEIGDDFDIPYTWRAELVRGTVKILCGLMQPGEFVPFIMDEYTMERDEALQVALAINERIFSAVKPQLASLHNIEDAKLAHKIKVPHKPKYEDISEAMVSPFSAYIEEITQPPIQVVSPPAPYMPPKAAVVDQIQAIREKIDPVETKTEAPSAPLSSSELVNKLSNMRLDPYKEKY